MPDLLPLHSVDGIRAFAPGRAKGVNWTEADIDAMVRNGERFGDLIKPTIVIGHEEDQPLVNGMPASVADNSGVPGFGRVTGYHKVFDASNGKRTPFLELDAEDVPSWLADMIRTRQYRTVSIELYEFGHPSYPADEDVGPVVRRVAFLGGELPQIKSLADIPMPTIQNSERRPVSVAGRRLRMVDAERRDHSWLVSFSETDVMGTASDSYTPPRPGEPDALDPAAVLANEIETRETALEYLFLHGFNIGLFEESPTAVLAEMVRVMSGSLSLDDASMEGNQNRAIEKYAERFSEEDRRRGFTAAKLKEGFQAARRTGAAKYLHQYLEVGPLNLLRTGRVASVKPGNSFAERGHAADEAALSRYCAQFAESNRGGLSVESLLRGFRAAKKLHPNMTVREFLDL